MSVKSDVLDLLKNKAWCSPEDFEKLFPVKTEGHLSYLQRLRELRSDGYKIIKRIKENCKHTFEYSLIEPEPPRTEQEEITARANFLNEDRINQGIRGKQLQIF